MSTFGGDWLKKEQNKAKGESKAEASGNALNAFSKFFGRSSDIESGGTEEEKSSLMGSAAGIFGSSEPNNAMECCKLSRQERFQGFTLLLIMSGVFFAVAFFIGLPLVLLSPGKFGMSFTLGSLLFMGAFAIMEGPVAHLKRTCSLERLPFTLVYITSMLATLYACIVAKSYIMTVACSIAQICALCWYALSQVPGGSRGLKYMAGLAWTAGLAMMKSMLSICFR